KNQNELVYCENAEKYRQRKSANRIKRGQNRNQPAGEKQSSHAAQQGQKHALSQNLPNQTPAASAKRATKNELPFAGDAACQLQIRHVCTTDQQKESDPGHEREQGIAHTTF